MLFLLLVLFASVFGLGWGGRWLAEVGVETGRLAHDYGELKDARRLLRYAGWLAPTSIENHIARLELELQAGDFYAAEQLQKELSTEGVGVVRARLLTAAAGVDLVRYRYRQARRRAHEAVTAAVASGQLAAEARALAMAAKVEIEGGGDARIALDLLQRARDRARVSGDERQRVEAEVEIGFVRWWYLREPADRLLEALQPAVEVFRRLDDPSGVARILDRMSFVELRRDNLVVFFATQRQALQIWERLGNRAGQAQAHMQLGWVWGRLENPRRAFRHFERALELAEASGFALLVPRIQRYLASAEITGGRPERSAARLEALIAGPDPWDLEGRSVFGVLGDARRRLRESAAARTAYQQALELDQAGDVPFRVWIGSGLARVALQDGAIGHARTLLTELEELVGPQSDWSDLRRVLNLRASVLEAESGPAEALAPLLEAAEIETRSLGSVGFLTVDYGLGVLKRLLPRLLASESRASVRATRAAEAFRLLEQARLRPVRQQMLTRATARAATISNTPTVEEAEALFAARQASARVATDPPPTNLAELRAAYASYEDAAFWARSGSSSIQLGRVGTVAEIQEHLPVGTTIICYVLVQRVAVALVLRHDHFEAVPLPFEPAELRPRIKILRHQLAVRRGDGWRSPARELGRLLIDPVETVGGLGDSERLFVVPMGELHELPFAALLDSEGRSLIERVAVGVLPAASALLDSTPRASGPSLVMGRDQFRELAMPDLPAARREAQAVARATDARWIFGSDSNEQTFRQLAPGASRLHIVAHARSVPEMPLLSGLVLAPPQGSGDPASDGELTVQELLALELRAELVTLSACRSGLAWPATRLRAPELRRTGLVEGFLLAGARNVLGTLLSVEDEATADFMIAFEDALGRYPPIDALAQVQRTLAGGDGAAAHPGHWAAFVLAGPGTFSGTEQYRPTLSGAMSVEVD